MRRLIPLLFLVGLLSACSLTVRPRVGLNLSFGFDLTPTIVRLEPDRGRGATYRPGEEVRFIISTNRSGYIALVGIDPDDRSYELDRFYLNPGTYTLPLPGSRYRYTVTTPYGTQRVRAIFTDTHDPSSVRFQGVYRENGWNRQTSLYIEASGAKVRDVAETYFEIR